ncbi:hypothetical protein WA026_003498 [Henosepilachna vigintioctopunctata]|uniref:Uncharacterized protein n=1 Tax=Henosepilachna vigintioctopunctata TaxID=420089 RepID=A0AAW1TNK4_9CUCU
MKVVVVCLLLATIAYAANIDEEDGTYREDNSGQYIPDDSGKYIPDFSGAYRDDGTGRYSGDQSGLYNGENLEKIRHLRPTPLLTNHLESGQESRQIRADFVLPRHNFAAGNPIRVPTISKPVVRAAPRYQGKVGTSSDGRWRIIKQSGDVNSNGYSWEYETENGITAAESGNVINKGTENESMQAKGFFQYTGPDNVVYSVTYRADADGFHPEGAHLPKPPPIPEAILRALEKQTGSRRLS